METTETMIKLQYLLDFQVATEQSVMMVASKKLTFNVSNEWSRLSKEKVKVCKKGMFVTDVTKAHRKMMVKRDKQVVS